MKRVIACTLPAATLLIAAGFHSAQAEDAAPTPPAAAASADAQPAPAPATTPAIAPTAATTSVAPDPSKPPGGWRAVKKGGEVYWCTEGAITGSRVRTERQCMTPAQYKEMVFNTRQATEEISRRVIPPSGG